ncbi:MAG TPA: hypothetical protein VIY66_12830 [Candidatus Acidoferrales bacterium]
MSNSSLAVHSGSKTRRSTRVNRAIQLAVEGVDSFRGPYHEEVSTITLNAHGCMYESNHEVLNNAFVVLQLNGKDAKPVSARGHVKWTQRPVQTGGPHLTAIELDAPGNIWGIDSPPGDWLPFCGPLNPEPELKHKAVAVLRPEPTSVAKEERGKGVTVSQQPSNGRPIGQLMGGFQQQMEAMLSDAAETVVRDKADDLLDGMRAALREEAERIVGEVISAQTGPWIDRSLKHLSQAGERTAQARHAEWTKKIEADLQDALTQVETRNRELEEVSTTLTTMAQSRLQGFLDSSRKDAVDRIIARLKQESGPVIDDARQIVADLTKRQEEFETLCRQSVEHSAGRLEETCARLDKRLETIVQKGLDSARQEIERAATTAAESALETVRASAQQEEAETQARLKGALEPVAESALAGLKEKAAEISRQFAAEMSRHSRSHLEFVSGAISQLAQGLGKLSKD